MARAKRVLGILLTISLLSLLLFPFNHSSVVPGITNWGSFRGNTKNQGISDSNLTELSLKWEFKADSSIGTTVIVKDRTAIFGTSDGTIYSIDSELGRLDWKINVGAGIYSTPAMDLGIGVVYICDNAGKVTCLNLSDGSTKWVWQSGSGMQIQSSPLVGPGGNIYFGSDDAYLYSLYPNGTLAWRFEGCNGWIFTSPSNYLNLIFFGSCDGKMRAVSSTTGQEQWNFSTQYIPSSPAVYGGRVYFGSYDSKFFCLDALTGGMIWNTTFEDDIYSSPSVSQLNIVVGCNDGLLYCLDNKDGNILWTLDLGPSSLETSPVISNEMVAVTYGQGLVIVHLSNGTIHRKYLYGDSRDLSPSVYKGKVFFGDSQGYIYCLQKGAPPANDDDDGSRDPGNESNVSRGATYFMIALVVLGSLIIFIYFRRKKH